MVHPIIQLTPQLLLATNFSSNLMTGFMEF